MPTLLRRLPCVFAGNRLDRPILIETDTATYRPRRHQIVIFIRLSHHIAADWRTSPGSNARVAIPAILDPGCTDNVVLYESHLTGEPWSERRSPGDLEKAFPLHPTKRVRDPNDAAVFHPRRYAKVWLFHNRPGSADYNFARAPLLLHAPDGVVVRRGPAPDHYRYPLVGLKALTDHGLRLVVSGRHGSVCLWKPSRLLPWNWPVVPWPWHGSPLARTLADGAEDENDDELGSWTEQQFSPPANETLPP